MDLKQVLLDVLDNPQNVWDSIVTNLAPEARTCLLTFSTCKAPADLVELQSAVARLNVESAAKFEASLRALDDVFITVTRDPKGRYWVRFRNPSMDDFCAGYLDANAGFATRVSTQSPSLDQLERLVQMSTAPHPENRLQARYPNLRAALLDDSTVIVKRLLEELPDETTVTEDLTRRVAVVLQVVATRGFKATARRIDLEARLAPVLMRMTFRSDARTLYKWLDDTEYARAFSAVLGTRFEEFYGQLAGSAESLADYDTLVNLDRALDRPGIDAGWADRFEKASWLAEDTDADSLQGDRDFLSKIAEHLDLDLAYQLGEYDEALEHSQSSDEEEENDDAWRESPGGSRAEQPSKALSLLTAVQGERAEIDALFGSLVARSD